MHFWISNWLSHHGLWGIILCSPKMVTVCICSKLKTSWKSVVFTNTCKVGKNSWYFVGTFNKTIILLTLVGYDMIIANSYPTHTCGTIIVKYDLRTLGLSKYWIMPGHSLKCHSFPLPSLWEAQGTPPWVRGWRWMTFQTTYGTSCTFTKYLIHFVG